MPPGQASEPSARDETHKKGENSVTGQPLPTAPLVLRDQSGLLSYYAGAPTKDGESC